MASPEPLKYNGYGEIITVENCQKYCDQVMSEVEKQTGKQYTVYVAEQYGIEPAGGRNFLIKVMSEVEKQTGKQYTVYVAEQYRIEPAGGRNFLIKVHVGGDNYLHMIVYQPLPIGGRCCTLRGVQEKKGYDPLEPFM
ncbi:hypothetical protein PAMA_008559 [Pampus argenteus]